MEILKGFIKKHIRLSIAALALLVVLVLIFGRGRNKALGNTYFDKQCVRDRKSVV